MSGTLVAALVKAAKPDLTELGGYAATDLRTYRGCVAEGSDAQARYEAHVASRRRDPQPWLQPSDPRTWVGAGLQRCYRAVQAARAAACTQFGVSAAHLLDLHQQRLAERDKKRRASPTRLELVAWRGQGGAAHVFLLAGREGGYDWREDEKHHVLSEQGSWGPDWHVVDPWAAAMGHPAVVYRRGKDYPFPGMLHPLELVITNDAHRLPPS